MTLLGIADYIYMDTVIEHLKYDYLTGLVETPPVKRYASILIICPILHVTYY